MGNETGNDGWQLVPCNGYGNGAFGSGWRAKWFSVQRAMAMLVGRWTFLDHVAYCRACQRFGAQIDEYELR